MAEFTTWVAANLRQSSGRTLWESLNNAESDTSSFSFAQATNGAWSGSPAHVTNVVGFSGRSSLTNQIPENSIIDRVECNLYFDLPEPLLIVGNIRIYRSSSYIDTSPVEILGLVGPSAGPDTVQFNDNISDSAGWAIANGGDVFPFYGYHENEEADTWQLNMRYCELRLRFTRAPNVPRTAFIAMF